MSRTLKVAAIQMDVLPSAKTDRLERAHGLVSEAAQKGAQLVVLPEVFNTGYAYTDANFENAETLDGPTVQWMQQTAAELNIHLAGCLLIQESKNSDIKNSTLLFAPDGRSWRYDKNYPWSWEHAYFVPAENKPNIVVAHTDIGDIGFLICWDIAHTDLWRRYAGKVDFMVICSCPPEVFKATLHLPSAEIGPEDMGAMIQGMHDETYNLFGLTLQQQLAWLGVPGISSIACGTLRTPVPQGKGSFLSYIISSLKLAKYMSQANQMELECKMHPACKVVDGDGQILAIEEGSQEAAVVTEITLPAQKVKPHKRQPKAAIGTACYFLADFWFPLLVRSMYKRRKTIY